MKTLLSQWLLDVLDTDTQSTIKEIKHEDLKKYNIREINSDSVTSIKSFLFEFESNNSLSKVRTEELVDIDVTTTTNFLLTLRSEDFEFGYTAKSEQILLELLKKNTLVTRNWLNKLFIKYFHDDEIVVGILRIIGRFKEEMIFPQGQTIALAALSHKSDEVKELGVRAFEKWVSVDSVRILKNLKVDSFWLQEYIDNVIKDLEETLYVPAS